MALVLSAAPLPAWCVKGWVAEARQACEEGKGGKEVSEDLLMRWAPQSWQAQAMGLWASHLPTALQGTGGAARAAPQGLKQQVPGPWAQEALHTGRQWRGAAPASTVGAVASPRVRPPTEEGAMRGRGRGPASRGRGGGHSKARLATGAGLLEWGGRGPAHIPSWPLRCPWPGRL